MQIRHLATALLLLLFSLNAVHAKHKTNHLITLNFATPAVEGWYFRAVSGYPAAISFEPVVLFKNGDYFEVGDEPLELLDVQKSKSSKPNLWGTWKKSGNTFYLTSSKGKTSDYKLNTGNWFPAYPFSKTIKLKKAYEKVSGGDYGNGTNALVITKITFIDATHFSEGSNGGIMSGNASAWKKSKTAGTYRIYGNTIELTYADKVVKKSFALGAKGSPPHPTNTMIFIGGDAYTDTE